MTDDELISLLEELPLRRLHVLARGRVHRHFRMGKPRLIDVFLTLSPQARSTLEAELRSSTIPRKEYPPVAQPPFSQPKFSQQKKATAPSTGTSSFQPRLTVADLLDGIGVPPSTPLHP